MQWMKAGVGGADRRCATTASMGGDPLNATQLNITTYILILYIKITIGIKIIIKNMCRVWNI